MAPLRRCLRLVALVIVTAAAFAAALLLRLRARLFFVRHDGRPAVVRAWARAVAAVIGLRVDASGPVPRPPCLVVANHVSYLDIIVLGTKVPAVLVAKSDVANWPIIGTLCRAAGTLFIDRASRFRLPSVLAEMARVLDTGGAIIVFQEGTSTDGRRVQAFRSSALEPVAAGGYPVQYAALFYQTGIGMPPAEQAVCWWGDMTLVDHLWRLLALPSVTARLRFGADPGGARDRRTLALRLHAAVAGSLADIRASALPDEHDTQRRAAAPCGPQADAGPDAVF